MVIARLLRLVNKEVTSGRFVGKKAMIRQIRGKVALNSWEFVEFVLIQATSRNPGGTDV